MHSISVDLSYIQISSARPRKGVNLYIDGGCKWWTEEKSVIILLSFLKAPLDSCYHDASFLSEFIFLSFRPNFLKKLVKNVHIAPNYWTPPISRKCQMYSSLSLLSVYLFSFLKHFVYKRFKYSAMNWRFEYSFLSSRDCALLYGLTTFRLRHPPVVFCVRYSSSEYLKFRFVFD